MHYIQVSFGKNRIIQPSDHKITKSLGHQIKKPSDQKPSDQKSVGLEKPQAIGLSDYKTVRLSYCNILLGCHKNLNNFEAGN